MVKSEEEVAKLLSAVRRAERAFRSVRKRVVAGRSEREIALAMEGVMRRLGASRVAFDLIVASGPRSAMPHGLASEKKIQTGDLVVIDFGAECDGYFSDMTRTLYAGKRLTGTKRRIFEVVRAAQEAAILRVKPGRTFGEIDKAAREVIGKAGFGAYFGHGTGHGIGLEVHERPYVAPKNQVLVEEGMVFTIEPGIYIPGVGGVRIEDMVLATADGCQVLTRLPRDWKN
jgi:Xaa-Pro aminopeptidase